MIQLPHDLFGCPVKRYGRYLLISLVNIGLLSLATFCVVGAAVYAAKVAWACNVLPVLRLLNL